MQLFYVCLIVQLTSLLTSAYSTNNDVKFKIINGIEERIINYPFLVGLMLGDEQMCGATIISRKLVLTAAHCVARFVLFQFAFSIFAGSNYISGSNGTTYGIDEILYHERYNDRKYINDIAILRIIGSFDFNEYVQPVPLAREDSRIMTGMLCEIVGWGNTETEKPADKLKRARVPVFDFNECGRRFKNLDIDLNPKVFCAGLDGEGHDTCQGDSGGPILFEGAQVGVVSFGDDCGSDTYPGVYTDIRKFNKWIQHAIDNLE